ncbi:MAG: ATP phosphoribosyltransferase regulatory subunit, partial [Phycisphaeraceae bacterium]
EHFTAGAGNLGLDAERVAQVDQICRMKYPAGQLQSLRDAIGIGEELADIEALDKELRGFGIAEWCEYDLGIVRGLAYYTGTVFELHEKTGVERALAGGGRYDKLIEMFGGPATPGVGFGMGDVVLSNVLMDKGLMPEDVTPRPDVFIIGVTDVGAASVSTLTAQLRMAGLHARFTYKSTRNLGKLIKDASNMKARFAVILDDGAAMGKAMLKDMASGEQTEVLLADLVGRVAG